MRYTDSEIKNATIFSNESPCGYTLELTGEDGKILHFKDKKDFLIALNINEQLNSTLSEWIAKFMTKSTNMFRYIKNKYGKLSNAYESGKLCDDNNYLKRRYADIVELAFQLKVLDIESGLYEHIKIEKISECTDKEYIERMNITDEDSDDYYMLDLEPVSIDECCRLLSGHDNDDSDYILEALREIKEMLRDYKNRYKLIAVEK